MLQLPLKHVGKSVRVLVSPTFIRQFSLQSSIAIAEEIPSFNTKDVVYSFKDWFKRTHHNNLLTRQSQLNDALLDRIFYLLHTTQEHEITQSRLATDLALSDLGLRVHQSFVLDVLNYGARHHSVLSCLKFFDWAGLQQGFYHTRATFYAIFNILSKAKHWDLIDDYLYRYSQSKLQRSFGFYNVLVMGYAVAGKPEIALQVFGRMRFQGMDLDALSYHILLNALVEQSYFEAYDVIVKQISNRGFENHITRSIMIKTFCKRDQLDDAEAYMRDLVSRNQQVNGHILLSLLIDALCEKKDFDKAKALMEELRKLGLARIDHVYGVWLRNLVQAGKLKCALVFLQEKKSREGYCPPLFRYNMLLSRLLREQRLKEVYDILSEMKEGDITPDKVTLNATLGFFCKAGMVNVALELYDLRHEFGLSPSWMTYNYLINTLLGDGSIDEAYRVLSDSIEEGYFFSETTFHILSDALCREGKLEMMKELIITGLKKNYLPRDSVHDKLIVALCKAGRVEDGYLIHEELSRLNRNTGLDTYFKLIHGFKQISRGDIAAKLLIEMQEEGYVVKRRMFRAVICCLCEMEDPETQVLKLLDIQLQGQQRPSCEIYNYFIDGAGHAKMPNLAREIYDLMLRNQVQPNLSSDILMLQSYLKNQRVSVAMSFFEDIRQRRRIRKKLWNAMIVGLCRVNWVDTALDMFQKLKSDGVVPSSECYESLVLQLCSNGNYDMAVNLIINLEKDGRPVTSFIGNTLLFHSLNSQELYEAWVRNRSFDEETETPFIQRIGQLIGTFCGRVRVSESITTWEELIEQCFPLDIFTYNLLLSRLSRNRMIDHACYMFSQLGEKGLEPNWWSYMIMIRGLVRYDRRDEARVLEKEMFSKGLRCPTR